MPLCDLVGSTKTALPGIINIMAGKDQTLQVAEASRVPLCVDLDGTLVRSDVLLEGLLRLLKHEPQSILFFPLWLLHGRARVKHEIAGRAAVDPAALPYNDEMLIWLRGQREAGRSLVLCTAAHVSAATTIAEHLQLFDDVLGSDGETNLSESGKVNLLVRRYGVRGFDYAGDGTRDLKVWARARRAVVVSANPRLVTQIAAPCVVERVFVPPSRSRLVAWLRALRLHQWAKNALIFVPAAVSHQIFDVPVLQATIVAFVCFGLCASGNYLINDLLDLEADRAHPRKRLRPFASGELSLMQGCVAAALLLVGGIVGAKFTLGWLFTGVLLLYLAATFWYSWALKRIAMVDVLTLAGLYTIRVLAGSAAILVAPSFWLLAFSMFMFFSLAVVKRYTELQTMQLAGRATAHGRGYTTDDIPLLLSTGTSAGLISVLVLALYVKEGSEKIYRHPEALWLLCPLMLYWILRVWRKAHRGELHDDPVVFAIRDVPSLIVVCLCALLMFVAT